MKSVAITGGASGIGFASAKLLLARGFAPWLLDLNRRTLAEACAELGIPAERGIVCDVADEVSVGKAIGEVTQTGQLAGVVNSAGIAVDSPAVDTSVEEFRRILEVNLIGSFIVSRETARIWLERGDAGSIVNISSISGMRGNKGRSAYGASKGGINTMTMVMANELGPHGIRVNAVAPGPIDTPLARKVHTADVRAQWHRKVPLRRYGTTEEVAGTVAFLISDDGGYVNGQVIAVDGGFITAGISE
ncbi:SDR family NAD(P)-dependent oxidoreductase [Oricola thermophila]|uniref:SDR family oxidoreductase n=1 Tax=Oricola thermophila TaxID=2742145 RepID=A0A6N1VBZ8_9HYPH|nr:SDR family NAD(P)-dependent oxidoreductase [Oricola thermophila]QKV17035.1 SDR family oxidoreductase [Oricola thermophila]